MKKESEKPNPDKSKINSLENKIKKYMNTHDVQTSNEHDDYRDLYFKIIDGILKNKVNAEHGQDYEEYLADLHAKNKVGAKDSHKAVKDLKRSIQKSKKGYMISDDAAHAKFIKDMSDDAYYAVNSLYKYNKKTNNILKKDLKMKSSQVRDVEKDYDKIRKQQDDANNNSNATKYDLLAHSNKLNSAFNNVMQKRKDEYKTKNELIESDYDLRDSKDTKKIYKLRKKESDKKFDISNKRAIKNTLDEFDAREKIVKSIKDNKATKHLK